MKDTFVEFVVAYVSHTHVHLEVKMGARFSLEVSRPNTHTLSLFHLLQKWEKESLPKTAKRSRKWPHLFFQNHCFFQRKNPTNFSDVLIEFRLNARPSDHIKNLTHFAFVLKMSDKFDNCLSIIDGSV